MSWRTSWLSKTVSVICIINVIELVELPQRVLSVNMIMAQDANLAPLVNIVLVILASILLVPLAIILLAAPRMPFLLDVLPTNQQL